MSGLGQVFGGGARPCCPSLGCHGRTWRRGEDKILYIFPLERKIFVRYFYASGEVKIIFEIYLSVIGKVRIIFERYLSASGEVKIIFVRYISTS